MATINNLHNPFANYHNNSVNINHPYTFLLWPKGRPPHWTPFYLFLSSHAYSVTPDLLHKIFRVTLKLHFHEFKVLHHMRVSSNANSTHTVPRSFSLYSHSISRCFFVVNIFASIRSSVCSISSSPAHLHHHYIHLSKVATKQHPFVASNSLMLIHKHSRFSLSHYPFIFCHIYSFYWNLVIVSFVWPPRLFVFGLFPTMKSR